MHFVFCLKTEVSSWGLQAAAEGEAEEGFGADGEAGRAGGRRRGGGANAMRAGNRARGNMMGMGRGGMMGGADGMMMGGMMMGGPMPGQMLVPAPGTHPSTSCLQGCSRPFSTRVWVAMHGLELCQTCKVFKAEPQRCPAGEYNSRRTV